MTEPRVQAEGLIAAAQAGDRAAFRELYLGSVDTVLGFARRRLAHHDAEDLTADVFSIAWRKLPDYQYVGTPFEAWLLTIAKNRIRSLARRDAVIEMQPRSNEDIPGASASGADVEAMKALSAEALRSALQRLPPGAATVLRLRFLQERSVAETARTLECSEENVRVRTFRALERLRVLALGELP